MPYFISASIYAITCTDEISSQTQSCINLRIAIASPLAILGFMNSLLNPIIYAWWHNGFRNAIKKTWGNCCKKKESSVTDARTSNRPTVTGGTSSTSVNTSGRSDTEGSDIESRPSTSRSIPARIQTSMSPDPNQQIPTSNNSQIEPSPSTLTPENKRITSVININLEHLNGDPPQKEHQK